MVQTNDLRTAGSKTGTKTQFGYRRHPDQDRAAPDAAEHPVVVVGAGPVGLSLAIDLAQRGQGVVLLDDADRIGEGSRAICFSKRSLEYWDRLGIGQRMVDKGVVWSTGRIFHGASQLYQFNLLPFYAEAYLVDRVRELPAIDQIGFGIKLLQVDEGGTLVPLLWQQVELIELRRAVKNPPRAPDHAFVDHALADAEPVPIFERAFRKADRPRSLPDPVGIVEQHDQLTALRQIDRERQSDWAGADHHHRMFGRIVAGAILIGMTAIAELVPGLRHAFRCSGQKSATPRIVASATI